MRVIENIEKERTIRCPGCKRLLAYTKEDIEYGFPPSKEIRPYIRCLICGYETLLDSDVI